MNTNKNVKNDKNIISGQAPEIKNKTKGFKSAGETITELQERQETKFVGRWQEVAVAWNKKLKIPEKDESRFFGLFKQYNKKDSLDYLISKCALTEEVRPSNPIAYILGMIRKDRVKFTENA